MDNLKIRRPADATKVNVNEPWELAYWTKTFGVTEIQLRAAVKAVGVTVAAVRKHLGK